MKKFIKIAFVVVSIALLAGWFYWQQHKKGIIKDAIENALHKGTNNLYYVHYDSSAIDEENGNASFYNVVLQSDSLQQQLLQFDTASANTIYNVRIDKVAVKNANIRALLHNTAVDAGSIEIIHPVVYIIRSGKIEEKILNSKDSLAIYEKLLGKYNSIHAGEIIIDNGFLNFADKTGDPHTALKNISIHLKNFSIDSTKDYQNIISYFINDVVVKVKEIAVKGEKHKATFSDLEYNAPGKFMRVKNFQQKNNEQQLVFDVNNTAINKIATDSFILKQLLKADELTSDGGLLTFYRKKNKKTTADTSSDEIDIDNNYFDEAVLNKISIGNTKILIYNTTKPADPPLSVANVKFTATDIQKLYSGTSIRNLIGRSKWILSGDGFSFVSANKRYKINVGAFALNSANATLHINNFSMIPQLSEATFSKNSKYQEDLYTLNFKNIELNGINNNAFLKDKKLEAETMIFEPDIRIFDDRTIAPNLSSKVGSYPHQVLRKIDFPINIKNVIVKNGYVAYKEKAEISKQTATVFFKNVNATISNVTNIEDLISKNNLLLLNANAVFMGVSNMQTSWKLPLDTRNGAFDVSGNAGGFNATVLNPITIPLGMVSIRTGRVNKVTFELTGNDNMAKGTSTFLYENLKIDILKNDSAENKKKGVVSFVANLFAKDNNPQNGVLRKNEINQERDVTKSFFYLLWKSVFAAAKKTVAGKNTDGL
ncbi:hypothetical protein [Ferruginibacter sp. SUN106]|uniref:hypothetical protein n=1 Tax=Ferruginibacter sp. SUN106 TaxID=2978348 RepID=UPI003D363EB0